MSTLIGIFLLLGTVCSAAQMTFVGVMSDSKQTLFAVRAENTSARWLTVGEKFGDYIVESYDAKGEALTLRKGKERIVLTLPGARVFPATDEVVAGLKKILNIQVAETLCDLLHPKLKPLFKAADCDSAVYRNVLSRRAKLEIRELETEVEEALKDGLDEVEKIIGVRPKHGFWTSSDSGRGMSFVVSIGSSWYLAPSVPRDR